MSLLDYVMAGGFAVMIAVIAWYMFRKPPDTFITHDNLADICAGVTVSLLRGVLGTKVTFLRTQTGQFEEEIFFRHKGFSCTIEISVPENPHKITVEWKLTGFGQEHAGSCLFSELKPTLIEICSMLGVPREETGVILAKL